jgi:hypothetical protein
MQADLFPDNQPPRDERASLFLTLEPAAETLLSLRERRDTIAWEPEAVIYPDGRLTLTLFFLDMMQPQEIGPLRTALLERRKPSWNNFQPVSREMDFELKTFEVCRGPDAAVLRPAGVPASLQALHREITEQLRELGYASAGLPHPFRPSVTLGRRSPRATDPVGTPIRWRSSGVALAEYVPNEEPKILARYS